MWKSCPLLFIFFFFSFLAPFGQIQLHSFPRAMQNKVELVSANYAA
jgi:hypothetical protein